MSRTTKRNLIVIAVAVLVAVFVSTLIGTLTNGFEDIKLGKEVNSDNLIQVDEESIELNNAPGTLPEKLSSYYDVNVSRKGVVTIDGENENDSEEQYIILWSSDELDGTYTFDCDVEGTFRGEVAICTADTTYEIIENNTFTATKGTTYYAVIIVSAGQKVDASFYPVLVEGEEKGSFYLD